MAHYYLMAVLLLLALAAFKIDGWISTIVLLIAMIVSSPVVALPKKKIKWLIVALLLAIALWFFPDVNRYREAFEESLETSPVPSTPENKEIIKNHE